MIYFKSVLSISALVFVLLGLYFDTIYASDANLNSDHARSIRSLRMNKLWTRTGYGIVFIYSNAFEQHELQKIMNAVAEIRKHSCIPVMLFSQFQFFQNEYRKYPHHVFIEKNNAVGCGQATVGMQGGYQLLTLSPDPRCLTVTTIIHEMLHTLGIEHEQSRTDRDQFIQVNNRNVQTGLHNVFNIAYGSTPYGPYDYDSVMHYGRFAFSYYPNMPTLSSKVAGHDVPFFGNNQLSYWDKRKINVMTDAQRIETDVADFEYYWRPD